MRTVQLIRGLQFIVSRVGDGYQLRAARNVLYIDVDTDRFTYDDKTFLADHCDVYTRHEKEGFMCWPWSDWNGDKEKF